MYEICVAIMSSFINARVTSKGLIIVVELSSAAD